MQNMSSDPRLESKRENRRQMLQIWGIAGIDGEIGDEYCW